MFYRDELGNLQEMFLEPVGDTLPIGAITEFSGDEEDVPSGWLLCDGRDVEKNDYPDLYEVISNKYGTETAVTFKLPDFRKRVPVGNDVDDTDFDTLGKTGGEKTHKLTVDEMPAHKHSSSSNTAYDIGAPGWGSKIVTSDTYTFGVTNMSNIMQNAGGGQAHNIMQPYIVINYIIKARQAVGVVGNVTDHIGDIGKNAVPTARTVKSYVDGASFIGEVKMFAASDDKIPQGWLKCDGAAVSRTAYEKLFAVIGTAFGTGNGATTFNLPDFRSRVPQGLGRGTDSNNTAWETALGQKYGEFTHKLTVAEMPSHNHLASHYIDWYAGGGSKDIVGSPSNTNPVYSGNTGGNGYHNTIQPILGVNFIIRAELIGGEIVDSEGIIDSPANEAQQVVISVTKTSDLLNDSGFITKAVSNLDNYYSKSEVDSRISTMELTGGGLVNVSDLNNDIGYVTRSVSDLDNYYNKTQVNALINNLDLSGVSGNIPTKISDLTNDSDFVIDPNYVHTDNNYTTAEKNRLANAVTNLNNYYNKTQVDNLIASVDVGDVPTKTSELQNDSGFITNLVNNLSNYYSKSEINNMLGSLSSMSMLVVTTLPNSGVSNVIYLVPKTAEANDIYDEYIYINNAWERIGSTQVNLSGYALSEDVPTSLADLTEDTNHRTVSDNEKTAWNNKQNSINDLATIRNGAEAGATALQPGDNVSRLVNDAGYTSNTGTITGIRMNGSSKGTSGVVDLGTVLTAHQDISGKVDKVEGKGLSTNDFTTAYKNNVDSNTSARHTHSNKSVLDGITAQDIANWNNNSGGGTNENLSNLSTTDKSSLVAAINEINGKLNDLIDGDEVDY